MSDVQRNIQTIQGIYAAFGRGDVPAILATLSPEVSWEFGTPDHGIPWILPGTGPQAVARFFGALQANLSFRSFEVLSVMGEGDWVVGLVRLEAQVIATGATLREECEAHIWRFDAQGRVAAMRHAADTHSHWRASDARAYSSPAPASPASSTSVSTA
jgi:uncharacterized protein